MLRNVHDVLGQFHHRWRYIQTQFSNFNLAQTDYEKELPSFPFMNMFVPTDMLTGLHSFANWLISITDIYSKSKKALLWMLHKKQPQYWAN